LTEATGQEVVAARPVDPDKRLQELEKQRREEEDKRLRELKAKQAQQLDQARQLLGEQKLDQAETVLKGILAESPDQGEAKKLLDRIGSIRQEKAEAEKKLAEKARLDKLNKRLQDAEQAATQEKYDEAMKIANDVLAEDPSYTKAKDRVEQWTRKKVELEERARQAVVAPQLQKLEADILKSLETKDFQGARQAADKMLSLDPKNRTAQRLSMRIDAEERANQKALAEAGVAKALEDAQQLIAQQNFDAALRLVREKVLSTDPENPKGLKLAATIEKGVAQKATQKEIDAIVKEAGAAEDSGNLDNALAAYQRAGQLIRDSKLDALYTEALRKERDLVTAIRAKKAAEEKAVQQAEKEAVQKAESLLAEGKWQEADALVQQGLKDPKLATSKALQNLAAEMPARRQKAERLAQERTGQDALAQAEALIDQGKVDEAVKAINQLKGQYPDLARKADAALAKAERQRQALAEAAAAARVAQAEKEFDAAMALLRDGKADEAEAALRKLDTSVSKDFAAKVAKAIEKDVVAARQAAPLLRARADLAKADALAAEAKFDEARRLAEGVKSAQPDLAREAEQVLARIQKEQEKRAREQERQAREQERLAREQQQAALEAKRRQAEQQYEAAMALLRDGKTDEAEAALKSIDTSASEGLAAKVAKVIEKDIPAAKAAAPLLRARAELAKADALVTEGKLEEARTLAQGVKSAQPDLGKEADRVLARIGREQAKLAQAQEQAGAEVKVRQEEQKYEAAMALLAAGRLEEAERGLRGVDTTVSKELEAKVRRAMEKDIAQKRAEGKLAQGRLDLEKAKTLLNAGKFDDAAKAAEAVLAAYPELAREAGQIIGKVDDQKYGKNREQEREVVERSEVLLKAGRLDAAEELLNSFLSSGPLKGDPVLKAQLAKVEQARKAISEGIRITGVEETYKAAMALIEAGKLDEAEKILRDLKDGFPRALAGKIDRALNKDIPARRAAERLAKGKVEVEKADALLADGKLEDARKVAEAARAAYPEAGQLADRVLSNISDVQAKQAEAQRAEEARKAEAARAEKVKNTENDLAKAQALIDEGKIDDAEKLLHAIPADLSKSVAQKKDRMLNQDIPKARQKAQVAAQAKQFEDRYEAGLKSLADGNLDAAEKAMQQLLADTGVPEGVAARARKVLDRDIPAKRRELKAGQARQELDRILGLDDLAKASQALEAFLAANPEFEKEAREVLKAIDARKRERVAATEKDAVQKITALVDAGQVDQAVAQADQLLATPELTDSVALRKLREDIAGKKDELQRKALVADAEKTLTTAEGMVEQGQLDEAEQLVKQVDRSLSNVVARRVDTLLNRTIPGKREEKAMEAAKVQLAFAQKAFDEGNLPAARTAAEDAANLHRGVEADARKLIAKIDAVGQEKVLEPKKARLAEGDKLLEAAKYSEANAIYDELEKEGYFKKEIEERKEKIKRLAKVGEAQYADKVLKLFQAATEAHQEGDFEAEQAAIEAVLVWDPENKEAKRRFEEIRANRRKWESDLRDDKQRQLLAGKVEQLLNEGKVLEEAGDLEGALAKYKQAAGIDPRHPQAIAGIARIEGVTAADQKKLQVAEDAQRQHRAQIINKWLKETKLLLDTGGFEDAKKIIDRIIALEGRSVETDRLLAIAERREVTVVKKPVEPGVPVTGPEQPARPEGMSDAEWQKWQQAQELLTQISREEALKRQERDFRVKDLCDQAEKQLKLNNFDEARKLLQEAETWDKENSRVRDLTAKWMILTGYRPKGAKEIADIKIREERIRHQISIEEMENLFRAASALMEKREYDEAIDRYVKVTDILRSLPESDALKQYREDSAQKLELARQQRTEEKDRVRREQETQAKGILATEQARRSEANRKQREALLARANAQMEQQNYGVAEECARELLNIDPMDVEARGLLDSLDRRRRYERSENAAQTRDRNLREVLVSTEEAATPITNLYEYPENWQEIIAKRPSSVIQEEEEPQWKKDMKAQMEKRISFDFVDTPLADVVAFLSNLTGATIILDPAAVQGNEVPVTLKVGDMRLGAALDWILRLVNLTYALRDQAIFISTKERVADRPSLRIYDVRDLLAAIPDYSGTTLPSMGEGGGGGGGGEDLFAGEGGGEGESFTGEDLVEFIRETVAPSSWGGEEGGGGGGAEGEGAPAGTISYRQGKLVIIQTPEIHRQIEDLLSRFRESAALQVHITARFIDCTENFMRAIGLNWSSINIERFWGNKFVLSGMSIPHGVTPLTYGLSTALGLSTTALLNDSTASAIINASQESTDATTLNAPELTCFNGQQARVAVVTTESYVSDVEATSTTAAGGGTSQVVDPEIDDITTGVNFLVRPTVSSDKRYVTLDLQPLVSDILRMDEMELTLVPGNPSATPPIDPVTATIELPVQSIKIIQTSVSVPDGGTLLIGGLMATEDSVVKRGVPYLDRIPLLRALVGHRTKTREKRYLVILIRANILVRDEMEPPERG
jgi:type II secretory pathway component GspD/PulD (secretin)